MKALVSGATGYIGRHLVAELMRRGHEVRCLARPTTDRRKLAGCDVTWVDGDFTGEAALDNAVREVDWVFHLAAAITAPDWPTCRNVNVGSTEALLAACARVNPGLKRFVFTSSIAAAGPTLEPKMLRESDPCRPISDYGRSKLLAEAACQDYARRVPIVVLRLTNVLGAGQPQLTAMIKLLRLRLLPMLGNGEPQTSLCFVQDAVASLLLAAEKEAARGRTYFVADGRAYSWRQLFETVRREMGVSAIRIPYAVLMLVAWCAETAAALTGGKTFFSRARFRDLRRFYYLHDASLIGDELGFRPTVDFSREIAAIVRGSR